MVLTLCLRAGFFALLLPIVQSLSAQTALVRGMVVDAAGTPISGARVTGAPRSGRATAVKTNGDGAFVVPAAAGWVRLNIARDGFLSISLEAIAPTDLGVVRLQVPELVGTVTVTEAPGYTVGSTRSATRVPTPVIDLPQTIQVVTQAQIQDQAMTSMGDVVRYLPGITAHQGENNRDQVVIRGNSSSADFFVNGVRDDVQHYRDLYSLERVEALKGPNAMTFGRGGGGGVINRVTKEAGFAPLREVSLQGGSFGNRRVAADLNQPWGSRVALRLNGVVENSNSFRQYINLEREGVNSAMTLALSKQTRVLVNYEFFRDVRVADRGITSFGGRPLDVDAGTFFGNPEQSHVAARVNVGWALVEHQAGRLNVRNRTLIGDYDRGYQNFVPGAVSADRSSYSLTAYNNATQRRNVFNQTDATWTASTGEVRHTLLGGMELGRQRTDNFRNTGYFNGTSTTLMVPLAEPATLTPATFRQNATDADNRVEALPGAVYVQDQAVLNRFVQLVAGFRVDRFDLTYRNHRNGDQLGRLDHLVSPRAGIVFKPVGRLSIYGNYSVSYLPSAGDQFSSLTTVTQQLKPEKFTNQEVGVKWDVSRALAITAAVFRLNRTNTRAIDPSDATRTVQTGSQRTNGFETGVNGNLTRRWRVAGGYAYQDAFITSATAAARAGAQVGQVPHHHFSVWNHYQIRPRLGAGLGILNRSDMFAAVDNSVVVPHYTRADAALFFSLTERIRLQANVENVMGTRYYLNADNNTNLSPGSPRAVRIGLTARF